MQITKFIFPFTPQTWVRTTQNAKTIFRIPEAQLQPASLRYKKRLIKYSEYKTTLAGYAKAKGYNLLTQGTAVYFFIPIPLRWSKADRKQFHGQLHHSKPDIDNLTKAFFDSLRANDEIVGSITAAKYWVDISSVTDGKRDKGKGWIEVHSGVEVYDPFDVNINRTNSEFPMRMVAGYNSDKPSEPIELGYTHEILPFQILKDESAKLDVLRGYNVSFDENGIERKEKPQAKIKFKKGPLVIDANSEKGQALKQNSTSHFAKRTDAVDPIYGLEQLTYEQAIRQGQSIPDTVNASDKDAMQKLISQYKKHR